MSEEKVIKFRGRTLPDDERLRALVARIDQMPAEKQTLVETAIDLMTLFSDWSDEERQFVLDILQRLHGMPAEDRETTLKFLADACERRTP